jgi:hypothetical protein
MLVDKFHGIITPTEMDWALKFKPISWYSLPSDVLTSLIYRVSGWLYIILCDLIYILISKCYGFATFENGVSTIPNCLIFFALALNCNYRRPHSLCISKGHSGGGCQFIG